MINRVRINSPSEKQVQQQQHQLPTIEQPPELPQLFKHWIPSTQHSFPHSIHHNNNHQNLYPTREVWPPKLKRRRWTTFPNINHHHSLPPSTIQPASLSLSLSLSSSSSPTSPPPPEYSSNLPTHRSSWHPTPPRSRTIRTTYNRFSFSSQSPDQSAHHQKKPTHSLRTRFYSLLHPFLNKHPPPTQPPLPPLPASIPLPPPPPSSLLISNPTQTLIQTQPQTHHRLINPSDNCPGRIRNARDDEDEEEEEGVRDANRRQALANLERAQTGELTTGRRTFAPSLDEDETRLDEGAEERGKGMDPVGLKEQSIVVGYRSSYVQPGYHPLLDYHRHPNHQSFQRSLSNNSGRLVNSDHPGQLLSTTPAIAPSDHYHHHSTPAEPPYQPTAMPILVHSRPTHFPFRTRRASSSDLSNHSSLPASAANDNHQAMIINNHIISSSTKPSTSLSHPNFKQLHHPPPTTHFERFQAKMSSVRLRSLTNLSTNHYYPPAHPSDLSPSVQPSTLHPPQPTLPLDIRLPWENTHPEEHLPTTSTPSHLSHPSHPPLAYSVDHHSSDSSSHLTLTSEPSSNKIPQANPWTSSNSPPELELGFLFSSPSLLSGGLPYCQDSLVIPSGLSTHPAAPILDGSSSTSEPTTVTSLSARSYHPDSFNHPEMACSMPRSQAHLPEPLDRPYVNQTSSSLTSRVRPTPSPRNNLSFQPELESPPETLSSAHRQSNLSTPLRALPLLSSYQLTPNQARHASDSSGSSLGEHRSAEYDLEVQDQPRSESDDSDGPSDQELSRAPHDSSEPMPVLTPKVTTQAANQSHSTVEPTTQTCRHEWITFDTDTPPVSQLKAQRRLSHLPGSTSNPTRYFDSSDNSKSQRVQSPGARARLLLLASPSASSSRSPSPPTRPILTSHCSQSASHLHKITVSHHPTENSSVTINPTPSSLANDSQPANPITPSTLVSSNSNTPRAEQRPSALHTQSDLLPPSISASHRHQSMYEMRPPATLPSYEASLQSSGSTRHIVLPREEEGREKLPPYSCVIHLEGWMPRKMEFKAPGVQAKDRGWKRQYVIVHGTMIRIYRSDPHTHSVPRSEDPYSSNFLNGKSIKTLPSSGPPPLHFHQGQYDSAPMTSLKEAALAKAVQLPTHHNCLHRVYSLQNAESGLAADYVKKKYIVRVRAEGEQFLLQAKDDRGVIDLIEALQAATNVSLDLDNRPLPKFITLPRRRRRRRIAPSSAPSTTATGRLNRAAGLGAAVVDRMVAEAQASSHTTAWNDQSGDRMADMLAEEQEAYLQGPC